MHARCFQSKYSNIYTIRQIPPRVCTLVLFINFFIIIVTVAVPRVCVCLFIYSFLPPRASTPRNIGAYVFTATRKALYIAIRIVIFAENASFRSYGRRHLLASNATNCSWATKYGYQRNPRRGHEIIFAILTKNASFRERLLRAHILNINIHTYKTSAHGHEKNA